MKKTIKRYKLISVLSFFYLFYSNLTLIRIYAFYTLVRPLYEKSQIKKIFWVCALLSEKYDNYVLRLYYGCIMYYDQPFITWYPKFFSFGNNIYLIEVMGGPAFCGYCEKKRFL